MTIHTSHFKRHIDLSNYVKLGSAFSQQALVNWFPVSCGFNLHGVRGGPREFSQWGLGKKMSWDVEIKPISNVHVRIQTEDLHNMLFNY